MKIIDVIQESDKEIIIITNFNHQKRILKALSANKIIKPISFLFRNDLIEKILFSFDNKAILKGSEYFKLKPAIIEDWMKYLYAIDIDKVYQSSRLTTLQNFKKHLIDHELLYFYPHLEIFFKNKLVIIYLELEDDLLELAINKLKTMVPCEIVPLNEFSSTQISYGVFNTIDEEVSYIARNIRILLDEGTSIENIKIVNHIDTYQPFITAILDMYELPYHSNTKQPLIHFEAIKKCLESLETMKNDSLDRALPKCLETIQDTSDDTLMRLYVILLKVFQPFMTIETTYETIKPMLLHALKHQLVESKTVQNTVKIVSDISKIDTGEHVFMLGCAETYFPRLKSEDDYLNSEEKHCINLDTANEENHRRSDILVNHMKKYPNITLTRALKGLTDTYFEATILEKITHEINHISKLENKQTFGKYGYNYDLLQTKKLIEQYQVYNDEHSDLKMLYPTFNKAIIPYNNTFTGLSGPTLIKVLPKILSLSYTKLNTFHKCHFRYMIEHLLKIQDPFDHLAINFGTLFHDILEKRIDEDLLTKEVFTEALDNLMQSSKAEYSARDQFFLYNSFDTLKNVFQVIKLQQQQTQYTVYKQEFRHEILYETPYPTRFVGVIDKIMTLKEEDTLKAFLIDYKTGSQTLKLTDALFGFNVQLVYYAFLLQEAFKDQNFLCTGIYEQSIFPRPVKSSSDTNPLKKALQLYGYTLDDIDEALKIDPLIAQESFVKGLRFKNNNQDAFGHHSKVFKPLDLNLLTEHINILIQEAISKISKGYFVINPKKTTKEELSCQYCQFKDVCYKTKSDYEVVERPADEETLYAILREKRGLS